MTKYHIFHCISYVRLQERYNTAIRAIRSLSLYESQIDYRSKFLVHSFVRVKLSGRAEIYNL